MMNLAEYRRTAPQPRRLPALGRAGRRRASSSTRTAASSAPRAFAVPISTAPSPAELVAVAGAAQQRACAVSAPAGRSSSRRSACRPAPIPTAAFPMPPRPWSTPSARPQFEEAGAHFESSYFLTFLWLPPAEDAARAETLALRGPRADAASIRTSCCAASSTAPTACCSSSKASCRSARWLDDAETLTYLHSTRLDQAPSRPRARDADVSRRAAGRSAADRRARAAARRSRICACSPSSASRPRPRPGSSTSSTGSPFPIAGRPARSCSTRPTPRSC